MEEMSRHERVTVFVFVLVLSASGCMPWLKQGCDQSFRENNPVVVHGEKGGVVLENGLLKVAYDLQNGTFRVFDMRGAVLCLDSAYFRLNRYDSREPGLVHQWKTREVDDELGRGRSVEMTASKPGIPELLLSITLYNGSGFMVLKAGINNTTGQAIRLKSIMPVAGGIAFPMFDLGERFSMLDGNGGAEETVVTHGKSLESRNNLLVTFGGPGKRRSLVMGGLTYNEFEKFAHAGQALRRRAVIRARERGRLLCYLNLGDDEKSTAQDGPGLVLKKGSPYTFPPKAAPEVARIVYDDEEVVLEARNLDPEKRYMLGFSWWDERSGRAQSVSAFQEEGEEGAGSELLLDPRPLPAGKDGKDPEEWLVPLPPLTGASTGMRLVFKNESGVNAVLSEAWLREAPQKAMALPLRCDILRAEEEPPEELRVALFADDPVGKRVDPGTRYLPDERFYIDFTTDIPFDALEKYGLRVRAAQKIDLNIYDFPTVCLWYAMHHAYGDGPAINTSAGAVAEMKRIVDSGFTKYARAAVRLVPDTYTANNEQGWWDDEHWRMYGLENYIRGDGDDFVKAAHLQEPYDTTKKWGGAVTGMGGIPLIYFQTGFRSEDYAKAHPGHMLFNEAVAVKLASDGKEMDYDPDEMNAWQRNGVLHGYDYTDPEFMDHVREVYANLKSGGVKGLMFDYVYTGWAGAGGMEDACTTTASAYRNIFRLASEGLGPGCYIHERNLMRGSDITLGLVTSQRIWGDTDQISPEMVMRGGLRWYKNRVVVNYDMDAKSVHRTVPPTRDGVRRLLTMAYVTSGRLLLGSSFARMTPEQIHDLSRIYPFHRTPRSARPVDAFVRRNPLVYDFEVNPGWHQVTFYNPENEPMSVSVDIAGDPGYCGLGLDENSQYHVYDFWNDCYVGTFKGEGVLEQKLRSAEARMMSLRRKLDRPQIISTDRHLMQGFVDLLGARWEPDKRCLSGRSAAIGGEPYKVVIALNGHEPSGWFARGAFMELEKKPGPGGLAEIVLTRKDNGAVDWSVVF